MVLAVWRCPSVSPEINCRKLIPFLRCRNRCGCVMLHLLVSYEVCATVSAEDMQCSSDWAFFVSLFTPWGAVFLTKCCLKSERALLPGILKSQWNSHWQNFHLDAYLVTSLTEKCLKLLGVWRAFRQYFAFRNEAVQSNLFCAELVLCARPRCCRKVFSA